MCGVKNLEPLRARTPAQCRERAVNFALATGLNNLKSKPDFPRRIASGRRIGAKATSWTACQGNVLDCMGGDGEGIRASLQA